MHRVLTINEKQFHLLKDVDDALSLKFPPTIMEISRKLHKAHGYASITGFQQAYYRIKRRHKKQYI